MKEQRLLPVGTKVFDVRYGWGKVDDCQKYISYPLRIEFANEEYEYYTLEGMYLDYDKAPLLSLTEYTLETGGFTPISDYWNKPKVGDWGYFWDREGVNAALFGRLTSIETRGFEQGGMVYWRCFSHDIPDHIKKQMEQQ